MPRILMKNFWFRKNEGLVSWQKRRTNRATRDFMKKRLSQWHRDNNTTAGALPLSWTELEELQAIEEKAKQRGFSVTPSSSGQALGHYVAHAASAPRAAASNMARNIPQNHVPSTQVEFFDHIKPFSGEEAVPKTPAPRRVIRKATYPASQLDSCPGLDFQSVGIAPVERQPLDWPTNLHATSSPKSKPQRLQESRVNRRQPLKDNFPYPDLGCNQELPVMEQYLPYNGVNDNLGQIGQDANIYALAMARVSGRRSVHPPRRIQSRAGPKPVQHQQRDPSFQIAAHFPQQMFEDFPIVTTQAYMGQFVFNQPRQPELSFGFQQQIPIGRLAESEPPIINTMNDWYAFIQADDASGLDIDWSAVDAMARDSGTTNNVVAPSSLTRPSDCPPVGDNEDNPIEVESSDESWSSKSSHDDKNETHALSAPQAVKKTQRATPVQPSSHLRSLKRGREDGEGEADETPEHRAKKRYASPVMLPNGGHNRATRPLPAYQSQVSAPQPTDSAFLGACGTALPESQALQPPAHQFLPPAPCAHVAAAQNGNKAMYHLTGSSPRGNPQAMERPRPQILDYRRERPVTRDQQQEVQRALETTRQDISRLLFNWTQNHELAQLPQTGHTLSYEEQLGQLLQIFEERMPRLVGYDVFVPRTLQKWSGGWNQWEEVDLKKRPDDP